MVDQIQLPPVQAFSGGADFSQLANLGNVYQAAQDRARQQQALASLGGDPNANIQSLIRSGSMPLAELGMRSQLQQQEMQNRLATQAENVRQFNLEQAIREKNANLLTKRFEADSPEYRGKQLDDMIAQGTLPPDAKQDPAWRAWQATGQNIPSSAIVQPQTASDRKAIRDADQQVMSVGQTIQQVDTLKDNISKALHLGPLTGTAGYVASFLPEGYGKETGTATELATNEALRSMIGQVKSAFGSQPSNKEDAWLLKAQASVDKAPAVQQQILNEAKQLLIEKQQFYRDQAQEMRPAGVKGYYGKEHQPYMPDRPVPVPPASAPVPAPAQPVAPAVKPSLSDFMVKARVANPGASDSDLANYWKKKYGS